ncbi:discoidin domain-containing protein [Isoptericola aurantiacus]|uniref:discoidin domain-containing protein n=1 Tax=Isoptericola aurantiacus TaxID=3377839 RepID=UPI00383B0846
MTSTSPRRPERRTSRVRAAVSAATVAALASVGVPAVAVAPSAATEISSAAAEAATAEYGAPDPIAADYYGALLRHTRWAESAFDDDAGVYRASNFDFAVVLGNAVLVTRGDYDEDVAGVGRDELKAHTVATIEHYAATNRLVDPQGSWGKRLFWDSTFQSYFLAAGHLLWDDLDATTRGHLETIAAESSRYTAALDFADDPLSGSWTARWPDGGYQGDTALEEAGVYTQALAPGLAYAAGDQDADAWRTQFSTWARNAAGLPVADRNNPAVVAGAPVSDNVTQNIYDSYLVENHGSFGPHYQSDIWRSGARNAVHFLLADEPLPSVLLRQPNSAELWRSIGLVMGNQGEPFMPMVADREFLYGRDVLPLAFVGQVLRDPDAVRAEAELAEALESYQAYPPVDRLTKFSGEPKYEPEARAELAIAYLLHEEAAASPDGTVVPTPQDEWFAGLAGVRDFGDDAGITAHQTADAWAAAVSKPGFVKFPWVPGHDTWLFDVSGGTPFLYPSTGSPVQERSTHVYTGPRDGFEASASVFRVRDGYAGQVTLPTGSALYASDGTAPGRETVRVRNLDLGGDGGPDGSRSYTTAEGTTTAEHPVTAPDDPADVNAARVDDLVVDAQDVRYVRVQGVQGDPTYGYSLYAVHAYAPGAETDLAAGRPATASSADAGKPASAVTDGDPATRWAVSRADRQRADSWIQVDLGEPTDLASVRLAWEAAAGKRYTVQTSADGETWSTAATYGRAAADVNVARLDTVDLTGPDGATPVEGRYVRMQGVQGDPAYGYSLYHLRAFAPDGTDVAAGRPATASSADAGKPASAVTDGAPDTRWAVSRDDRLRDDSWIQVDLGTTTALTQVQLGWEAAAGAEYRVQVSDDGATWTDVGAHEETGDRVVTTDAGWLDVDGVAGFVTTGDGAITVTADGDDAQTVELTDGTSGRRLVEMVAGDEATTRAVASRDRATVDDDRLVVSDLDGYLSVLNLSDEDVAATVTVRHEGPVALFAGTQTIGDGSSAVEVSVPAGTAQVLAPRAEITPTGRHGTLQDLDVTVHDGRSITVGPWVRGGARVVSVRAVGTGAHAEQDVVLRRPRAVDVRLDSAPYPVADLALAAPTFPASVLPDGMTSPGLATDGDPDTSWVPGPQGRMVVDLGRPQDLGRLVVRWDGRGAPASTVAVSDDGLDFTEVDPTLPGGRRDVVDLRGVTARYVALSTDWSDGDPGVTSLQVLPPGADDPELPGAVAATLVVEGGCMAGDPVVEATVSTGGQGLATARLRAGDAHRTLPVVVPGVDRTVRLRGVAAAEGVVELRVTDLRGRRTVLERPYGPVECH